MRINQVHNNQSFGKLTLKVQVPEVNALVNSAKEELDELCLGTRTTIINGIGDKFNDILVVKAQPSLQHDMKKLVKTDLDDGNKSLASVLVRDLTKNSLFKAVKKAIRKSMKNDNVSNKELIKYRELERKAIKDGADIDSAKQYELNVRVAHMLKDEPVAKKVVAQMSDEELNNRAQAFKQFGLDA